jgi:hypothetical protein
MKPTHTEADLAAVVVAWLQDSGAAVYQEVEVAGGVADIVARVGPELWIIETKLHLSLALLVQAYSPVAAVLADPSSRAKLLAQALADLQAFSRKYDALEELAPVREAIRKVEQAAEEATSQAA